MTKLPQKIWHLIYKNIMLTYDLKDLQGLEYWKHRIYAVVATVMIIFGVPLLLFGSLMFYMDNRYGMATFEMIVALLFVIVILCPVIHLKVKKILIIMLMYAISLALLFYTGPSGAGFVCVTFTIVVSGCLLDFKVVKFLVAFNVLVFLVLSLMMLFNLLDRHMVSDYGHTWTINVLTTQGVAIGLLLIVHWIYEGLEHQNHKIMASERKLKIRDARYEGMVAHIYDVITIIDARGAIKYISPNIYKLFGWMNDAILENRFLDFIHQDDQARVRQAFMHILNLEGQSITGVFKFLKGSGETVYIEVTAINLMNNPSIKGVLASFRDVTTRVLNEAALIEAKDQAEAAEKAKSQFLSVMSHEIRTPLNGIMGMTQLLLETELTSEQKSYLDVSMTSSKLLLNLMNDVLDYSKLKAYSIVLEKANINIHKILDDLEYMYAHEAREKGLSFLVRVDEKIQDNYLGDGYRLRQVLMNLLNNAFKFTSQGYVEIQVDLDETLDEHVRLLWTVSDSGIGMTMDQQRQIFGMFYQGEASISRQYGGSGLGLPICKDIVALMGGQIWVLSEMNQGSVFKFTCVLEKAKENNPVVVENLSHKGLKILIAEDDEISRLLLKKFSKTLDWIPSFARNGLELIEAYEKDAYDLILMDVNMPVMDGLEASKKIREIDLSIPIIGVSAFASSSDIETCIEAGMNATVSKPIDFKLLKEKVTKWRGK